MSTPSDAVPRSPDLARTDGLVAFFVLACAITWVSAAPAAWAFLHHEAPAPYAVGFAGLSAFGPLLAAAALSTPGRRWRELAGRWRTSPAWVVLALIAPLSVHLTATALYTAAGGHASAWAHPPVKPEDFAALVVFPVGEELGWRGFAYPRLVRRVGAVRGALVVGAVWGLWHLAYSVTPAAASFDGFAFVLTLVELPLYSLLIAWVFERSGRSIAVAIAFHAGGHLDHIERAGRAELGLHVAHVLVLAVVAVVAARALARRAAG